LRRSAAIRPPIRSRYRYSAAAVRRRGTTPLRNLPRIIWSAINAMRVHRRSTRSARRRATPSRTLSKESRK
jgi:hypothetical protein